MIIDRLESMRRVTAKTIISEAKKGGMSQTRKLRKTLNCIEEVYDKSPPTLIQSFSSCIRLRLVNGLPASSSLSAQILLSSVT